MVLEAYRHGAFPMADPDSGSLDWYIADPRGLIDLDPASEHAFHVPRRLAKTVRSGKFRVTSDRAFGRVIRECAAPRPPAFHQLAETEDDNPTWIDERIIDIFERLHAAGLAHSVEAWLDPEDRPPELVGGLYGLALGGAFFAESKFSRPALGGRDASKVCLVSLVDRLRRGGFTLLDVQFWNPHLDQFNVRQVEHKAYMGMLAEALEVEAAWGNDEPDGSG